MFNMQHLNISHQISYYRGTDKVPIVPFDKRNLKQRKLETRTEICELQTKLTLKNHQNGLGKNNDHKRSSQQKKNYSKKKTINPSRNVNASYISNERRIKTEELLVDSDYASSFKKSTKQKNHHKSIQQPLQKTSDLVKKTPFFAKSSQTFKSTQLDSCKMLNSKKLSMQQAEYSTIQLPSIPLKKRRVQSTIISHDKVISKLLNDSILGSELAGSLPNTYDNRQNALSQSCRLKQYMSTTDMRIIHSMQNDVPIFTDQKQNLQQNAIRRIMKSKKISLEELTRKVLILQRFFRRKIQEKVIYKYKILFEQVSHKIPQKKHMHEFGGLSGSIKDFQEASYKDSRSLLENQNIILAARPSIRRKITSVASEQKQSYDIRVLETQHKYSKQVCEENGSLNFKKYRQLVNNEIIKLALNKRNIRKQKHSLENDQSFLNILDQIQLSSCQPITFEPVKQPKSNSIWMENILDSQPEFRQDQISSQLPLSQKVEIKSFQDEKFVHPFLLPIKQNSLLKSNSDDSVGLSSEDNIYDKLKYYQSNYEDRARQCLLSSDLQDLHPFDNENTQVQKTSQPLQANQFLSLQKQQMARENVVINYLDCGISDFGINLYQKMVYFPKVPKASLGQNQNQLTYLSEQAIETKFKQASQVIMIEATDNDPFQIQPSVVTLTRNSLQLDRFIEDMCNFLINEFSTEISIIMRKDSSLQQQRTSLPKCPGIITSFHSIRDFLRKFIGFLTRQKRYIDQITEIINKYIGPTSLQILSYLRPQPLDLSFQRQMEQENQCLEDQEDLFVVPAKYFYQFQYQQQNQYKKLHKRQMNRRIKTFSNFWHRCIFQSFNECLDFQRPYGIQGKPYLWVTKPNLYRKIKDEKIVFHLQRAQSRVLELTSIVGGVIFQNSYNSFQEEQLSEYQKHMINQERLSRILASQILQSQPSWINYIDQSAQLLFQISRIIEQRVFIEYASDIKKLLRKRKMMLIQSQADETIIINLDQF